ncbi:tripartite tricarboxylate transporter substrate-binding protein [Alphaproteobacteria bacterium]|jgi:tripartite-type tricarboxylate transporter receptor subunit TctC|nr:tripartite tricarboxylate transporter substrate-binding protein [Alphaproteobacteria bacterium]MDC0101344.1 tripartite tricarboxylate transporter substrate-binding protein [Alphaproteobacteria bacterium]
MNEAINWEDKMGFNAMKRRQFLKTSAAAGGTLLAGGLVSSPAWAAYPDRNIDVIVPTRAGGGADRLLRAVSSVWKKHLNTNFEPGFFPGASGRVGYEVYMGKYQPDAYSLIFGNMGPEVLNWAVKAPSFDINDYFYFGRVDTDPGVVFVGAESKFQSIDDIIAEGKKRKLNVGTSRLAHPASIGILALGEEVGVEFNLVPLSGGKKTVAGAVTLEMDFCVLTSGSVIAAGDACRTLLVFDNKNLAGDKLSNAPTMNDYFGTKLPPMYSARAFGIHKAAADKHPDRMELLQKTFKDAMNDPAYKDAFLKSKGFWPYSNYGGVAECEEFKNAMLELGGRYRSLLTGK